MGTPCHTARRGQPTRPLALPWHSPPDNDGRTAYTYDAWGRTLTKSRAVDASTTHEATYVYRFGQRLKSYTTNFPGEQSAHYNYDGLGKRRNKLVNGDATWFRWDAGYNMIAEYDGGADQTDWDPGDLEMSYVPGLAQVPGTNPATGDYAYFMTDHLGTVRSMLNQSKVLMASMEYTPYGKPYSWGGNVPAKTYTGHHWDGETSMYFAPYRHYMPGAGRWLTRDPLGMVDGPNVYGYVKGNPISRQDRLGQKSCSQCYNDHALCTTDATAWLENMKAQAERSYAECIAGGTAACAIGCVAATFGYAACLAICVSGVLAACTASRAAELNGANNAYQSMMKNCRTNLNNCLRTCCDE